MAEAVFSIAKHMLQQVKPIPATCARTLLLSYTDLPTWIEIPSPRTFAEYLTATSVLKGKTASCKKTGAKNPML
jgi:putative intracellular protease/amidase